MQEKVNYNFLDGLRGLAAIMVYYHHLFNTFFGQKYEHLPTHYSSFQHVVIKVTTNGNMWVMVFFMISGFVLPLRMMKNNEDLNLFQRMIKRYIRLMLPLLFSCTLIYICV